MAQQAATDFTEQAPIIGSADAFGELANPYRRELLVHCYRMLGSIDDAEDAVQDAYVRAWRGRDTFREAISFRAWLYRIATNACLDAIDRRKRGRLAEEPLGVGPFPDDEGPQAATASANGGTAPGPEARYDAHESISLAFTTVLQLLPPRQRAVLILRDVLSWHAAEVAELLDLTVPAVNSALHRARTTMASQYGPPLEVVAEPRQLTTNGSRATNGSRTNGAAAREPVALGSGASPFGVAGGAAVRRPAPNLDPGRLRALLERYVQAWESADIPGLVALLRDDAVLAMPPVLAFVGRDAIAEFMADSIFVDGRQIRLVPVRANDGPAFVTYSRRGTTGPFGGFAVLLIEVDAEGIARIDAFRDLNLIPRFGLPGELPA